MGPKRALNGESNRLKRRPVLQRSAPLGVKGGKTILTVVERVPHARSFVGTRQVLSRGFGFRL